MAPYRVQARAPPHAIWTARSPKMAHAPGRGMAPFCRHRTIPGCPDAYRRCCARSNPRLMRCAPPRRTAACARRPPRTARSGLDLRRDIVQKRGLLPLPTHQPPLTPLRRPTLPTAQGLAQAEKPNPACKGASPAPSLKPSAAHGQIGRSPAEFARGGSSDQPRPQWAFGSDESTHQLSSIAQVHAMAAGCFHRLSAQPHRDAPPRAQSFGRPWTSAPAPCTTCKGLTSAPAMARDIDPSRSAWRCGS